MNILSNCIIVFILIMASFSLHANQYKSLTFGAAEVIYDFKPLEKDFATLTITASINENNDSYRNTKNSDLRRLGKLGQLIYQCKLLLYQTDPVVRQDSKETPLVISKYFSLLTNVDQRLPEDHSVGIDVHTLAAFDSASLFSPSFGTPQQDNNFSDTVKQGSIRNLKRINLDVLSQKDQLKDVESLYLDIRFPVFQLNQPVNQWSYSFNIQEFQKAISHTDEHCSLETILGLIQSVE